jgi:hypothetical protein
MTERDDGQVVSGGFLAYLRNLLLPLWRRLVGPPPVWTEADFVPAEAEPICPTCTLPHSPHASRCPHCREYVSPYRMYVYLDWVYIWGRGMQDLAWRRQLTPFLRWGTAAVALGYLGDAAGMGWAAADSLRGADLGLSTGLVAQSVMFLLTSVLYFVVFVRLLEAAWRRPVEVGEEG